MPPAMSGLLVSGEESPCPDLDYFPRIMPKSLRIFAIVPIFEGSALKT